MREAKRELGEMILAMENARRYCKLVRSCMGSGTDVLGAFYLEGKMDVWENRAI